MNRRKFLACLGLGAVTVAVPKPKSYFFFGGIYRPRLQHTVIVHPGESIQAALDRLVPGGTLVLKAGVHSLQHFAMAEGKHIKLLDKGRTVLTGCHIVGESQDESYINIGSHNIVEGNQFRGSSLVEPGAEGGNIIMNNVFGSRA